ncbi:MAG TPA: phosphotransferase [Micromonosporaceae bacterium]|jgi:Ser/Thr protein kinase RdoA (MazF antagonist)
MEESWLNDIAAAYGLGEVLGHRRMGGTNDNYAITTPSGAYLCKIIVNMPIDDILAGLPFLRRLEEYGFSEAVFYLRTPDGRTALQTPDYAAVVLPFLEGTRPVPSVEVSRQVGAELARMHRVPADGLPDKRHWNDSLYLPETLAVALARHGADSMRETLRVVDELRLFDPGAFPQVIIHGDMDTSNSLMTEDGIRFLDWQDIAVGAAIMDIAGAVLGFCFDPDFQPALFEALATGYGDLSAFEAGHLLDAMRYAAITQSIWLMSVWDQYRAGEPMVETSLLYWEYGMDRLRLPEWPRLAR